MDLKCTQKSIGQLAVHQMKTLLVYLLFMIFCLLSVSAHGEIYRLIGDHYLDIGNRWEYQIYFVEHQDFGPVDRWGTQIEEVTANQVIKGTNTRLMETTETIPQKGASWIDNNYQFGPRSTPECLLNYRSETVDSVRLVKNSPFKEAPVWVSDSDWHRPLGDGDYDVNPEDPNNSWEGSRETFVTFLQTETITVPAGTFDCIVVSIQTDIYEDEAWISGYDDSITWFDPNIGIIQSEENYYIDIPGEGIFVREATKQLTSTNLLPSKVTDPSPNNGAVKQSVNVDISWSSSPKALSYDVYFGECGDMQFQGNQSGTSYDPGPLLTCTTYCWRIDAVNANGTISGSQWSFTTGSNVPDLRGLTEAEAQIILNSVSLTKGAVTYDYSSTVPVDSVMDQNPDDGTTAECGSSVDIVISTGPWPDINGDALVNFSDFFILIDWWMHNDCNSANQWCGGADLYQSGNVDNLDLAVFYDDWLKDLSLVGHWKMDDDIADGYTDDFTPYGHTGTIFGNLQSQSGYIGNALQFDGDGDFVEIEGYKGVTGAQSRTCAAWIKTSTIDQMDILYWGEITTGKKWRIRTMPVNSHCYLRTEVEGGYIYGNVGDIADGGWHHIAVVLENDGSPDISEAKLFVDGTLESFTTSNSHAVNTASSQNVLIGYSEHGSDYEFIGSIDDVRIYDRALSQDEISDMYQNN